MKDKKLFSEVDAYIGGELDEGLFVFSGKPANGVTLNEAEAAIDSQIEMLKNGFVSERELQKVKNKIESTLLFSEMNVLNKAMSLAIFELMGDAAQVNNEAKKYLSVTPEEIQMMAREVFTENNSSVLYYRAGE